MHHLTSWRGVLAISTRLALGFCLMTVPSIDTRSQFFTPPSPKGTGEITYPGGLTREQWMQYEEYCRRTDKCPQGDIQVDRCKVIKPQPKDCRASK